jgi:hypothetical protein
MNSKIIFDYILYLENENNDFKNKNDQLIASLNDLNEELNSLKKVSLMLNFNKQLKEKNTIITNLENEIRNIKNNLDKKIEIKSEADIEIKSEADIEIKSEADIEIKSEVDIKTKSEADIKTKSEVDIKTKSEADIKTNIVVNEDKKKKKPKNCEIIKYKLTEYLLNNDTNEIFELNDKKLLESIGILKNGKVKFYNK